jgi:hypothetical protein
MNMGRLFAIASLFSACTTQAAPRPDDTTASSRVRITVGSSVFAATLSDNAAAKAFAARLPLTVKMADLNANEKHVDLAKDLPRKPSNPGTIRGGDLMLYGSNTLVLFYKTFPTSYSYTRLGTVDDVTGLAAALGSGDVTITFEL